MSIELPEARIIALQMAEEITGKRVASVYLQDYERIQRIGFINKDIDDYKTLEGGRVESVVSRGNVVLMKFDNGMNLLLGPEYGGRVLYHAVGEDIPEKIHLRVDFKDRTALTVRLTGMGIIHAVDGESLSDSYLYKRDFSTDALAPDAEEFTYERFSELISERERALKATLVGKEAVVVGLSNSAFQDVIYRAGLHPKRKASKLDEGERRALYKALGVVIEERLRLGGKDRFQDIHGVKGRYVPAMGPKMKGEGCPVCGTQIDRLSIGGGQVYFCPVCQK